MDLNSILLIIASFMLVVVTSLLYKAAKRYADATKNLATVAEEQRSILKDQTTATRDNAAATDRLLDLEHLRFLEGVVQKFLEGLKEDELEQFRMHQLLKFETGFLAITKADKLLLAEQLTEINTQLSKKMFDDLAHSLEDDNLSLDRLPRDD